MPPVLSPLQAFQIKGASADPPPDIIEFVVSDRYANRPNLYPRQATLLKVMFLQTELFTQYDYDVLEEWASGFAEPDRIEADAESWSYVGAEGIQPDILDRIAMNRMCPCGHDRGLHALDMKCRNVRECGCFRYRGRKWFRQVEFVGGRRGSKGHTGALAGAYVLWNYHCLSDPQNHYGVDRDKKLSCQVFAGKKEQARDNQWRDLANVILGSACFRPWISRSQTDYLSIFAPYDFERMDDLHSAGIDTTMDQATFTIEPKEATVMSSRGPASFCQFYDEFAHVVRGVAKIDGFELEDSAKPALDQFGVDAFMYQGSSPWTMTGRFYENYERSLEVDADTKLPIYPEMMMVQLPSWAPYVDWDRAHTLDLRPPNRRRPRKFCILRGPIQAYDEQLQREERANPETFAVERRARWATALDAYLNPQHVDRMWLPWPDEDRKLLMQDHGVLAMTYHAHGDPSKSGANFGFAVAHTEGPDERGLRHIVFDLITHWEPGDFPRQMPNGETVYEIDYDKIEDYLKAVIKGFIPEMLSFDQFNSTATIQRLQKFALEQHLPKRVTVFERTATAPLNWKTYETFKTALNMNLVHAPFYQQADNELKFLQKTTEQKVDHPTVGPVQTKDVADCVAILTYELLGEQMSAFLGEALSRVPLGAAQQGGTDTFPQSRGEPGLTGPERAHHDLSRFSRTAGRGARPGVPRTYRRGRRR